MKKLSFIPALLLILCTSCDSRRVYEHNVEIGQAGWSADDIRRFEVEIVNPAIPYNIYINIRNTDDYKYSNLWVFMTIEGPDGRQVTDTLECPLADPGGRWYGSGIGDIADVRILVKKDIRFVRQGKYTFSLEQAMRSQELKNILNVGLRIERAQ
ncbi:MAG: gliding motility lipoprotein GldH [Flavobacteriales bacterium]